MSFIGAPISRIDGHAKVTGAAKYAAEPHVAALAYGSVVVSRIAKGRILRIDANEAMRVAGVIAVLTHKNRPHMARTDTGYADDVAPDGSPFRPLYNDSILFCGQPIALVIAEEPEVARFAASLVHVDYAEDAHETDLFRQRDHGVARPKGQMGPPKARGSVEKAFAAAEYATRANIMCPWKPTIQWNSMHRPRSGRTTTNLRSMTKPRACRMFIVTSAVSSA